jgi:Fe-S cluster assembly iron-binding protein IscA
MQLTEEARQQLTSLLQGQGEKVGLRLYLKGMG